MDGEKAVVNPCEANWDQFSQIWWGNHEYCQKGNEYCHRIAVVTATDIVR